MAGSGSGSALVAMLSEAIAVTNFSTSWLEELAESYRYSMVTSTGSWSGELFLSAIFAATMVDSSTITGEVFWRVYESSNAGGSVLANYFNSGDLRPWDLFRELLRTGERVTMDDFNDFTREPLFLGEFGEWDFV